MKEMWESRYAEEEYIYGTAPNSFFKSFIDNNKAARILLAAEGEGRNAVYAASKGWDVYAFDQSEQAKLKALKLSEKFKVHINYTVSDLFDFNAESNSFDVLGVFYLHLPTEIKLPAFTKLLDFLKPGGKLIMEVFHKDQLENTSGGPKTLDLLYSIDEIQEILKPFKISEVERCSVLMNEGKLHQGLAEVIRIEASK